MVIRLRGYLRATESSLDDHLLGFLRCAVVSRTSGGVTGRLTALGTSQATGDDGRTVRGGPGDEISSEKGHKALTGCMMYAVDKIKGKGKENRKF